MKSNVTKRFYREEVEDELADIRHARNKIRETLKESSKTDLKLKIVITFLTFIMPPLGVYCWIKLLNIEIKNSDDVLRTYDNNLKEREKYLLHVQAMMDKNSKKADA